METWMVVKYAQNCAWPSRFEYDPKKGAHISYSAHYTFAGATYNCAVEYLSFDEAQKKCDEMNKENPCGCYAVCPVSNW